MGRSQVDRPGPAWDAMAVVSILYFPMAALAMGPYLLSQPTALFSAWPEDAAFRVFLESALEGRTGPYQAHLAAMVFHTLTGSLLMLLGPYLLWSRPRRRTRAHVLAGRLYLATVLASMTGALVFLVTEPLDEAFTGPVFALGLWAMFVGTVLSALLGWVAALRHRIRLHVLWVCLNYGFVMGAPLLRIEWGLFGMAGVGDTVEEVSPQAAIHVVALSTMAAVVGALHIADRLRPKGVTLGAATRHPAPSPAVPPGVVLGCVGAGLVALGILGERYLEHGSAASTNLAWFVVPVTLGAGATLLLRQRAVASGRAELADEHTVLLCWVASSPVIALGVAVVARVWLGLGSPIADATGVTLCGGLAAFFAVQTIHVREELAGHRRGSRTNAGNGRVSRSREDSRAS